MLKRVKHKRHETPPPPPTKGAALRSQTTLKHSEDGEQTFKDEKWHLYCTPHPPRTTSKVMAGYSQVLFPRSAADFALFVEEVEHAPQDGQQQDDDDDDGDDNAFAPWGEEKHRDTTPSSYNGSVFLGVRQTGEVGGSGAVQQAAC